MSEMSITETMASINSQLDDAVDSISCVQELISEALRGANDVKEDTVETSDRTVENRLLLTLDPVTNKLLDLQENLATILQKIQKVGPKRLPHLDHGERVHRDYIKAHPGELQHNQWVGVIDGENQAYIYNDYETAIEDLSQKAGDREMYLNNDHKAIEKAIPL